MIVEVTKDNVLIKEGSVINAGEICVNKCVFHLPECFEGLVVTAVFNNIPVPLANGECFVPSLEKGNAVLGVYAYKDNNGSVELMYSPRPTSFFVYGGSYSDEINEEAVAQISQYEQYCRMILNEYESLEASVEKSEEIRATAEDNRKSTFEMNESLRQSVFMANENARNAVSNGAYTNLLKCIAEESTTTELPTQFPCKKTGMWYYKANSGFTANASFDCYLFEVSEGERLLISNYTTTGAMSGSMACVLDENFASLYNVAPLSSKDLLGGMYAMPENAKYVALNTPSGSNIPNVTLVSESVIKTKDMSIPEASKFIAPQKQGNYHLYYWEDEEGVNLTSSWGVDNKINLYANGIYSLESGVEYVLYFPDIAEYATIGYICNESFNINTKIEFENFDKSGRYVFTATENDKYIALNSYNSATIQFGENKAKNISKSINIGKATFDGKHDITLENMGVVDRMLTNKKWVSYGDSITAGADGDARSGVVDVKWQDYIVDRYQIGSHINMGVGYSSLAMKETYSEIPMSHDDRLNALIAEVPDIVTILGGANDYIFNIPIGTYEDVENKNRYTFKGAYAYIIDKILSAKPDTTIILLGMFLNTMGNYAEGKGTYPLGDYRIATKEIAERFGLPFVDLNECGFNSYNFNTTDGVFSKDGIHPNKEGYKRVAMVLSKWFDAFKGTIY